MNRPTPTQPDSVPMDLDLMRQTARGLAELYAAQDQMGQHPPDVIHDGAELLDDARGMSGRQLNWDALPFVLVGMALICFASQRDLRSAALVVGGYLAGAGLAAFLADRSNLKRDDPASTARGTCQLSKAKKSSSEQTGMGQ